MEISFEIVVIAFYIFCYFVFGLKGATRFVDNKISKLMEFSNKRWLRYLLIAIIALVFAFFEFARLLIIGILKIVCFLTGR